MKKGQLLVSLIAGTLLLTGCSSSSKSENGKDVLASIDEKSILADDIYDSLSSNTQGKTALFSFVLDELIKEKFPVNDDMKENAADMVKDIESNYKNQYGDDYEEYLQQQLAYGNYKDLDEYEEDLVYSLQYSEFIKKYVKDNFDKIYEDYYQYASPRKLSLIKVDASDVNNLTDEEKENLEEVKKLLKTDKSFGDIASSYSTDDSKSARGNIGIIDNKTSEEVLSLHGDDVAKKALELKEDEVSNEIKGSDGIYFLYCETTDKTKIKEELKTVDITSPLLTYDEFIVYLAFQSYDLKYDDKQTQQAIEEVINDALKERESGRSDD